MTKYKIGDKVRVRKDLIPDKSYYMQNGSSHWIAISYMCRLAGEVVTITQALPEYYHIAEYDCKWTDEMFDGLATETKTEKKEIKLEGNMKFEIKDYKIDEAKATVVVFFEDGDVQKAKCCDGDTYDFERGLEVCIMKHICGGTEKYRKALKVADEQIIAIDKAKKEAEKRAEIKARQKAKRAAKRRLRAERRRAERIAEMREAYLSALQEYNGKVEPEIEEVVENKEVVENN